MLWHISEGERSYLAPNATTQQTTKSNMDSKLKDHIMSSMTQTQAAALAVLANNVKKMREELIEDRQDMKVEHPVEDGDIEVLAFWRDLESIGVESINRNDGRVVEHIGAAAKQMNPLLD